MSESSIGVGLRSKPTKPYPARMKLVFDSEDCNLPQLKQRLGDIEALMVLVLGPRN